jgi:hypothetical protein
MDGGSVDRQFSGVMMPSAAHAFLPIGAVELDLA